MMGDVWIVGSENSEMFGYLDMWIVGCEDLGGGGGTGVDVFSRPPQLWPLMPQSTLQKSHSHLQRSFLLYQERRPLICQLPFRRWQWPLPLMMNHWLVLEVLYIGSPMMLKKSGYVNTSRTSHWFRVVAGVEMAAGK